MSRFENKVALITGGGTGIGKATAEAIIAGGGKVVVTGRRKEPLEKLASKHPDSVKYIAADVAASGGPAAAVNFAIEQFDHLDIVINNAGVGVLGPLTDLDDEALKTMSAVNVEGVLITTREAIPHLTKTKGTVVNISSTMAQVSMPGAAAYSASKAAVERITAALAVELGPLGIRVNAVAPGVTQTDIIGEVPKEMIEGMVAQTPLGRIGQAEDIAKAVAYLASDEASWITGQVLQSSGGLML